MGGRSTMHINSEPVSAAPRAAATVVMLRDADQGLEVFLIKRHGQSDVLAGAHVFPGGKVDARDAEPGLLALLDQPPSELPRRLNEPAIAADMAASLYVAALREAFEESGVLFAQGAGPDHAARAAAMVREGQRFDEALASLSLRLDTRRVLPWSRWITPVVPTVTTKRFDTRFFLTTLPPGQRAQHDNHEATDSAWLRPRDALRRCWDGEITLAAPQLMSLAHLSHYRSVRDALAAMRDHRPSTIAPEPFTIDGERTVCYPGDERHPVRARAMPGPTRLVFRNRRFEPPEGFDAFFTPAPPRQTAAADAPPQGAGAPEARSE